MSDQAPARHPLARLLAPLEPLGLLDEDMVTPTEAGHAVVCHTASGPAEWLTSGDWRLFASVGTVRNDASSCAIARFSLASGTVVEARQSADGSIALPFSLAEAYRNYTSERWTKGVGQRNLSPGLLSAFYRVKGAIPRSVQLTMRRALIRWQGLPPFPRWPYDDSVGSLLRFAVRCSLLARGCDELSFRWFWPGGARAAAILTHDVESADGLRNAVRIADLEEARGLRSSFNVVGRWYDIDWGIVDELRARGFELGVHGVYHDRSLFSSREEFDRQQPMLREAARRLQARGFRSPATHRVHDWIAELPVDYDCTVPMSDPYEPQPGGSCSPWPFFLGGVVELPYTLPQDHTLYTLLRRRSVDLWQAQVERLEQACGLVQCLTHPDPGYLGDPANEARYVEFLDFLAGRDSLWLALPREVAAWWKERDGALDTPLPAEIGVARMDDRGAVTLVPPALVGAS